MSYHWAEIRPKLMVCTLQLRFQLHPSCKGADSRNWVKALHHCIVRANDPSDARTQVMAALQANLGSDSKWELGPFSALALSEVYQPANMDLPWDLTITPNDSGDSSAPVPC